jgi:hypothetical protein
MYKYGAQSIKSDYHNLKDEKHKIQEKKISEYNYEILDLI